jgi:hypothetical protein
MWPDEPPTDYLMKHLVIINGTFFHLHACYEENKCQAQSTNIHEAVFLIIKGLKRIFNK